MARQFFIKDKSLKPENIKSGVKILNVTGTYEGGTGDCEQWPSLLGINNGQSSAHAGVIFDTGFPIADGHINDYFNGYFSSSYSDNDSFFLFGNRSNVNPETGNTYYWGIWNYQDKLVVSFGSLSRGTHNDCAVFTLGPSMNDYDVPMWDLPISWIRTENPDYGSSADEYGTEYIYEVKVGNIIKYAPAFDDRLKFFDGLNMCVFGRNASESPGGYGAGAPSATRCGKITVNSEDGEHNAYEMELDPYVKNGTATLMKRYKDFTAGQETVEPLEPILHEGAETIFDNFQIYYDPYEAGIEVVPSTKEQHIDTVSNTDVFPYVTVKPMNLVSASETITENGQVVINAPSYNADGISEIILDISVGGGGGGDWLADALAGNITDLSGYSLPAPNHDRQYYYLFWEYPVEGMPDFSGWTSASGNNAMEYSFYDSSISGDIDMSSLTSINSEYLFNSAFESCSGITSVDLSNLATVANYGCYYMFSHCDGLTEAHLDSLPSSFNVNKFTGMFSHCSNLKTVYCSAESLYNGGSGNVIYDVSSIENLYLTTSPNGYDIYIKWQPNLTADSVLNILQHITHRNNYRTYSVNFYTGGLTVQDDAQGSIQAAYDAAVALNWSITNLTITPDPGL